MVCGPTATGKTRLAISLAKKFDGEVISADSRQVYKGMDIGTGKDVPKNSKTQKLKKSKYEYYEINGAKIWGYDLAEPRMGFSVGEYIKIAREVIGDIWERNKPAILVGGAGLYIKAVVDGIPTVEIPPNVKLRKSLSEKTIEELYEMLANSDPVKAASLNFSDKSNPRRLIRALEVALFEPRNSVSMNRFIETSLDVLFIGLTLPLKDLLVRIENRIEDRVKNGVEQEIKDLLSKGVTWKMQSMTSLGYREWRKFFEGSGNKNELIADWIREEKKYAKRQITWFKKDKRINWFDITGGNWQENVEKLVGKWYIVKVKG